MQHENSTDFKDFTDLSQNSTYNEPRDQEYQQHDHQPLVQQPIQLQSRLNDSWSQNSSPLDASKDMGFDRSMLSDLAQIQDQEFIRLWLSNQKSPHTIRAYKRVSDELLAHLHPKTLKDADLSKLQLFVSFVKSQKPESKRNRIGVIRSLFSFAQKSGYLVSNPAILLPNVASENRLSERYITEEEAIRMITLTESPRDRAILKLLYSSGIRASEFCSLRWKHILPREDGSAQIQIEGKGGKVRNVGPCCIG